MRRRDLLQAAGLAATVDLDSLGDAFADGDVAPESAAHDAFRRRLPRPSRTPDGRYDATFARRLDAGGLVEPELMGEADAHASVVSARATLTVGLGGLARSEAVAGLEARGYDRAGAVEGRPRYVRRGRYRQSVAVADAGTLVVGRGPELGPVESLVRAVGTPSDTEPLAERLPAVGSALDRLGSGTVLSVSVPGRTRDGGEAPLVTGRRLALQGPVALVRDVAVFDSRAARRAAVSGADESTLGAGGVTHDGRSVVHDRRVPRDDLPLAGLD